MCIAEALLRIYNVWGPGPEGASGPGDVQLLWCLHSKLGYSDVNICMFLG